MCFAPDERFKLIHSEAVEYLRTLPTGSVDAAVTDPPYALSFMGRAWDSFDTKGFQAWTEAWAVECLRVLKPGGHLLAFGGSRTYHRLACGVEDAGFEVRDQIMWVYGSGFPKSLNVASATASAEEGTVGTGAWAGWGTALKPAHEPILVARKPLVGTVADNVLAHGTGGLNIDGCRVPTADDLNDGAYSTNASERHDGAENYRFKRGVHGNAGAFEAPSGRWPANLVHDGSPEVLEHFPTSSRTGQRREASRAREVPDTRMGTSNHKSIEYTDVGSAARFFYCAKASKTEREAGLGHLDAKLSSSMPGRRDPHDLSGADVSHDVAARFTTRRRNIHPTVKPIALMRWLCRLVTPPGGIVLDPFAGSGTTGCAALLEGFRPLLIEREAQYIAITEARLAHFAEQR